MKKNTASMLRYKSLAHTLAPSYRALLFLLAAGMFLFSCDEPKEIELSPKASITTLTLTVANKDYEITFTNKKSTITVPYSTEIPAKVVVKQIELSAGATSNAGNELSVTDNTITLTVTAEDKKTTETYTVTVQKAAASSEASLTSLTLTVGDTDYEVTFEDMRGRVTLPYGMPIPTTAVEVKQIALSSGATSVDQGTQLTVTNNTVTLTVTAENGTTERVYTVRLAASVGITSFTFEVPNNESMALDTADHKRIVGKIDQEAKTITFAQQSAYVYRDKLKATFEVSEEGAAVQVAGADQTSGTTEQDFTSSVAYAVRAQDGTETTYRVTLTKSTMATIPDDRFRTLLKNAVPEAFTGDELDITHPIVMDNNDKLIVNNEDIISLKGIEFFTALYNLNCNDNALTSLDVSRNTALTKLQCYGNSLTSLNVDRNTALTYLDCDDNSLPSLDVRKNTALTELSCISNSLTSLDVSENTALKALNCSDNDLTSLDVSANTALTELGCRDSGLTSLDVSGNTSLTTLKCQDNSLTSLDMTGMRSVTKLDIGTGKKITIPGIRETPDNHLLATLRVNTALQDRTEIIAMKAVRKTNLTITTVNDAGEEQCANYTPATDGGNCNAN